MDAVLWLERRTGWDQMCRGSASIWLSSWIGINTDPVVDFVPTPSCRFHGIQPSKNSREKRAKKAAEEVAKKKLASDVGATSGSASLAHMKQVQKQAATPYVVLSGTIKPGQSRDATSGE